MSKTIGQSIRFLLLFTICSLAATSLVSAQSASVTTLGVGNGTGSNPPQLLSSRPVIGETVSFVSNYCSPSAPAYMLLSAMPLQSTDLGGGSTAYIDLATFVTVGPFSTETNGTWFFSLNLPNDPAMAGADIALQLLVLPLGGGYEVTNGLNWKIGL